MSTGDNKINIYLKKFLPQQQMVDNFLEFLLKQNKEAIELLYPDQGFFFGNSLAPGGVDEVVAATPMQAVDGLANVLRLDPADAAATFENALGITYYVGARYNQLEVGTEVNVRTGQVEYTFIQDSIGEKGDPDAVVDNGSTLTLTVDGVTEAGVSNAGRKAIVYLKQAVSQADAFFVGTVTWNGSNNVVDTTNLLGQTAGLVSVDPADYVVFIPGLTISRNTNLSLDPNIVFYGELTGTGAGNPLTVGDIDVTGSNLLFSGGAITPVVDSVKAFLVGGGDITWDLDSETLTFASDFRLKIPGRPFDFQILATTVNTFADGEAIYIDRTGLGGIKPLIKSTIAAVPNDPTADVIAIRFGDMIYFRNGALELLGETGESTVGKIDGTTQDTLDYLGARSEGDSAPAYSIKLGSTQNKHLLEGDNLTLGLKKLDARNDIVTKVKTIDFDSISLPTTIPMVIHGQSIAVGEQVLFVGLNQIHKLTDDNGGLGPAVWTLQEAFNNNSAPENMSLVGVQAGEEDFVETVYQYTSGRGWRPLDNSELMSEPTGFRDRTNSTFTFTNGTRTFEITPVGGKYFYAQMGKVFRKDAAESVVLPDTEGLHFIFFDGNTLTSTTTFNIDIITAKTFVATVYWNSVDAEASLLADERHGLTMDGQTHAYLHQTNGMQFASGLGISGTVVGDGSADADAQIDLDGGLVYDEDLVHSIVHSDSPSAFYEQDLQGPGQIPVYYKVGATGYWKRDAATDFPLKAGAARPQWNDPTGPWSLVDASADGKFIAMYIIATNDVNQPIIAIMGQREDDNLANAQSNNTIETLNLEGLPTLEFKALYRIIYETDSTYSNTIKARQLDITDLRFAETLGAIGGITPTDHNALGGRSDSGAHPSQAISTTVADFGGAMGDGAVDLKLALKAIDDHFKQFRIKEHPSNKQRVVLSGASVVLDSGVVLEQEIRNLIVDFDGLEIDFQTGEIFESDGSTPFNGGANDFTPVIPPVGENRWASITMLASAVGGDGTISMQPLLVFSETNNTRAAFANGTKTGQVRLEESAAAIANILESAGAITRQGVGGGSGSGGTGDASDFQSRLDDMQDASPFALSAAVIFDVVEQALTDVATASFSIVDRVYKFLATQNLITVNLIDFNEFTEAKDLNAFDLVIEQDIEGDIDTGFTAEVAKDGANYVQVPMERNGNTGLWRGDVSQTGEPKTAYLQEFTTVTDNIIANDTAQRRLSQKFVVSGEDKFIENVAFSMSKIGSPLGGFKFKIIADDSGFPSTDPNDVLWTSPSTISSASLPGAAALQQVLVLPNLELAPGTYHFVLEPNAAYIASFNSGVDEIRVHGDTSGGSGDASAFDGATWSAIATTDLAHEINGNQEINSVLDNNDFANGDADEELNTGAASFVSQELAVTGNFEMWKKINLEITKTGSPLGQARVLVVGDNAGDPDTSVVHATSDYVSIEDLSGGLQEVEFDFPNQMLPQGVYHLILETDQDYKDNFTTSVDAISVRFDNGGSGKPPYQTSADASTWAPEAAGISLVWEVLGWTLDLRVRVTASAAMDLANIGLLFDKEDGVFSSGEDIKQDFFFDGTITPDDFEFEITKFAVDRERLFIVDPDTGQYFVAGGRGNAIQVDGQIFTMPDGFEFQDRPYHFVARLLTKSVVNDTSTLQRLIADQYLASTDSALNKGVPGRGLKVQQEETANVIEITVNEAGDIELYDLGLPQ